VHALAERVGDDPAVLLRNDAKRKQTADTSVSAVIAALAAGFSWLVTYWVQIGSTFALRSIRPWGKRLKFLTWKGGRVV
jgi:hypothetical protein